MEESTVSNRLRALADAVYTRLLVTPRYQRRFHAFCLGTEKSGTHSVAALTARVYRSDHEPDYPWLIPRLTETPFDRPAQWEAYLRRRDRLLWLEMESNWLHISRSGSSFASFPVPVSFSPFGIVALGLIHSRTICSPTMSDQSGVKHSARTTK